MMPLISVVMPVYNERLDFLVSALNSVLSQSLSDFEFLIIDDSDDLAAIQCLEDYAMKDSRITLIRFNKRIGLTASINYGITVSKSDFIARVDSDDIQNINRFKLQLDFFDDNKDVSILGTSIYKLDENNSIIGYRKYPEDNANIIKIGMIKNPICHPTVMFRKSIFKEHGMYDIKFNRAEDYELWRRLFKKNVIFSNLSEPLVSYRVFREPKRDFQNWTSNLKIKLKYFCLNYFFLSCLGILLLCVYIIFPSSIRNFIYNQYNKSI